MDLRKPRVIIESPYNGDVDANTDYLRKCVRDCIGRGEAPFASHGFYTHFLNDKITRERELGIECGFTWALLCDLHTFYTDLGWSPGMLKAIHSFVIPLRRKFELRSLDGDVKLPATLDEDMENLLRQHIEEPKP